MVDASKFTIRHSVSRMDGLSCSLLWQIFCSRPRWILIKINYIKCTEQTTNISIEIRNRRPRNRKTTKTGENPVVELGIPVSRSNTRTAKYS